MESPILPKFHCDLCGYKAALERHLRDHINGVHLGVKPHKCKRCDFATAHAGALVKHKKRCPFVALDNGGKSSTAVKVMRTREQGIYSTCSEASPISVDKSDTVSNKDSGPSGGSGATLFDF